MKLWKIIALVLKHKELADLLVCLAKSLSDGKLDAKERDRLIDKFGDWIKALI